MEPSELFVEVIFGVLGLLVSIVFANGSLSSMARKKKRLEYGLVNTQLWPSEATTTLRSQSKANDVDTVTLQAAERLWFSEVKLTNLGNFALKKEDLLEESKSDYFTLSVEGRHAQIIRAVVSRSQSSVNEAAFELISKAISTPTKKVRVPFVSLKPGKSITIQLLCKDLPSEDALKLNMADFDDHVEVVRQQSGQAEFAHLEERRRWLLQFFASLGWLFYLAQVLGQTAAVESFVNPFDPTSQMILRASLLYAAPLLLSLIMTLMLYLITSMPPTDRNDDTLSRRSSKRRR